MRTTFFFDERGFAEHQLWSVSKNLKTLEPFGYLDQTLYNYFFNIVQNGDVGLPSIILAGRGLLKKMLKSLEPHGVF